MWRRWLPFPLLTLLLLATWLLLNRTLSPGHLLLGTVFAVVAGRTLALLQEPTTLRLRAGAMLSLLALVAADIARSNWAVARIVLSRSGRGEAEAGFIQFPLRVRHPWSLAMLACILTGTPGTSWAGYDAETGVVTVHILDNVAEAEWIEQIQGSYESRLLEIFG